MVGIPVSWLVDLMSVGVHQTSGLAPPSPSPSSSTVKGWWAPSPLGLIHCAPTTSTSAALREEEATLQPLLAPWEALSFWQHYRKSSSPLLYPSAQCPAKSFKWVNIKCSGKLHLCKWCKKQTSNWDSMVSHCIQEHLEIHLFCPQCGMSWVSLIVSSPWQGGSITSSSFRLF